MLFRDAQCRSIYLRREGRDLFIDPRILTKRIVPRETIFERHTEKNVTLILRYFETRLTRNIRNIWKGTDYTFLHRCRDITPIENGNVSFEIHDDGIVILVEPRGFHKIGIDCVPNRLHYRSFFPSDIQPII